MSKSGKLINIEGLSTPSKLGMAQEFGRALTACSGVKACVFPSWFKATKYGEHVWSFLQTDEGLNLNNLTYAMQVLSVKRQFIEEYAYPLLRDGVHVVVSDFHDALTVGIGRRGPLKDFMRVVHCYDEMEGLNVRPDLSVYMDLNFTDTLDYNKFKNDAYPDPWEALGAGYSMEACTAWQEHISEVKKDIAHEKAVKLVQFNSALTMEQLSGSVKTIAEQIANDQFLKIN
jgi:hypothetical protein